MKTTFLSTYAGKREQREHYKKYQFESIVMCSFEIVFLNAPMKLYQVFMFKFYKQSNKNKMLNVKYTNVYLSTSFL